MSRIGHDDRIHPAPAGGLRRAGRDLSAGLAATLAVALVARGILGLPISYLLETAGLYTLLAGVILWRLPASLPGPGLGAANRITLGRSVLVLPVAALALQPATLGDAVYWWIIATSTVAMILDGVDGWVARHTTPTPLGGRFDLELDAFLLLALSVLVWESGRAGAWVILIGALRYLFVATGWVWPALTAELPPSRSRKVVCVIQGIALLVCVGPIIPATVVPSVAVVALALLGWSFAVDVVWLARYARAR